MSHSNSLVAFLRHYGPIPASDNMYDELIHTEIEHYSIEKPIEITPPRVADIVKNFQSQNPKNVILTGTAGDGKTYHCRLVWEKFKGNSEEWRRGIKTAKLNLPSSGKELIIIKDLSELTKEEKDEIMPDLADAIRCEDANHVYLVAANDGQLLASWREFADPYDSEKLRDPKYFDDFKVIEDMLVDGRIENRQLSLLLYNLSNYDGPKYFQEIVNQVMEHPQWDQCHGCPLLPENEETICPIRINRERLRDTDAGISTFNSRLSQLLKLASANRMHLPIRDLLLLCVNILLGDHKTNGLLSCRKAINRAKHEDYDQTNPYANVFGKNLKERHREQYQAFSTLDAFGIGRETDNNFDNLLIYGPYEDQEKYNDLIGSDYFYGGRAYEGYLKNYLEGDRENQNDFMRSLTLQRQRLFFSLQDGTDLSPWSLSVFQSSGLFLEFGEKLLKDEYALGIVELLVRGLNRTFCGMMIDDTDKLYIASSGGDGRGRIATILNFTLDVLRHKRNPYLDFKLAQDNLTPCIRIVDPVATPEFIDEIELQISHFEYLIRVATGSLPASFSRQCYEDFLDFKLRIIKKLEGVLEEDERHGEINFETIKVNASGKPIPENIRIRIGQQ